MTQSLGKNPLTGVGTEPATCWARRLSQAVSCCASLCAGATREHAGYGSSWCWKNRAVGRVRACRCDGRMGCCPVRASARLQHRPRHLLQLSLVSRNPRDKRCRALNESGRRSRYSRAQDGRPRDQLGRSFSVDSTPQTDTRNRKLTRALFDVVEMAVEKGRQGFILLLDEAQVVRDREREQLLFPYSSVQS